MWFGYKLWEALTPGAMGAAAQKRSVPQLSRNVTDLYCPNAPQMGQQIYALALLYEKVGHEMRLGDMKGANSDVK